MKTLSNGLVTLTPMKQADMFGLINAAHDARIWRQHQNPQLYHTYEFSNLFMKVFKSGTAYTITDNKTGHIIGMISPDTNIDEYDHHGLIEVGNSFLVHRCWGGVYNAAVKELLYNYIFDNTPCEGIKVYINNDNIRSIKANAKFGFKQDHRGSSASLYILSKQDWEEYYEKKTKSNYR